MNTKDISKGIGWFYFLVIHLSFLFLCFLFWVFYTDYRKDKGVAAGNTAVSPTIIDPDAIGRPVSVFFETGNGEKPGTIYFKVRDRWDYGWIIFADDGFDGVLDYVEVFHQVSTGLNSAFFTKETLKSKSNPFDTLGNWETWTARYLEVRTEAMGDINSTRIYFR